MHRHSFKVDIISTTITAILIFVAYKVFNLPISFVHGAYGYLIVKYIMIVVRQIKDIKEIKRKEKVNNT